MTGLYCTHVKTHDLVNASEYLRNLEFFVMYLNVATDNLYQKIIQKVNYQNKHRMHVTTICMYASIMYVCMYVCMK